MEDLKTQKIWSGVQSVLSAEGYRVSYEYPGFLLVQLSNGVDLSIGTVNPTITADASARDDSQSADAGSLVADSYDTMLSSGCNDSELIKFVVVRAIQHFERLFDASAKEPREV